MKESSNETDTERTYMSMHYAIGKWSSQLRELLGRLVQHLRPLRGVLIGSIVGVPLGFFGVGFGALTGFLIDQALQKSREQRLPRDARAVVTLTRYAQIGGHTPVSVLRDGLAILVDAGILAPRSRLNISGDVQLHPISADEARVAARRLRRSLSETYLTQLRSVFRAASATADLSDAAAGKVLNWLRGEPGEPNADDAPSGAVTKAALVLGLPAHATLQDAKKAYRTLAAQFHPDTTGDLTEQQREESAEAFRRVQEAYETYLAFVAPDPADIRGAI